MKSTPFLLFVIVCILLVSCTQAAPQPLPIPTTSPPSPITIPATSTLPPSPTQPPSTETLTPTFTLIPSDTSVPPTPTPPPQALLLRRPCGRDYVVKADQPVQVFYGGWAVKGKELSDEWATALVIDLTLDGETIAGELQPPADDLPYNCKSDRSEDVYWLYSVAVISGLPAGEHRVSVVFNALRALSDGTITYGTGKLLENTFRITAQ